MDRSNETTNTDLVCRTITPLTSSRPTIGFRNSTSSSRHPILNPAPTCCTTRACFTTTANYRNPQCISTANTSLIRYRRSTCQVGLIKAHFYLLTTRYYLYNQFSVFNLRIINLSNKKIAASVVKPCDISSK